MLSTCVISRDLFCKGKWEKTSLCGNVPIVRTHVKLSDWLEEEMKISNWLEGEMKLSNRFEWEMKLNVRDTNLSTEQSPLLPHPSTSTNQIPLN